MSFFTDLEREIAKKHLLTHPFYQAWSKGELTLECLQEYAMQYYHHVKAFPRYLSALHSHTEDAMTRKELLKNLIDEEAGSPNHPEMWRAFALRLGATEAQMDSHVANYEMQSLVQTLQRICKEGSTAEGLAALYAYESQIPAVSESKIEGLKKHYNLTHPDDWRYFSVHIEADKEHAETERQLLAKQVTEGNAKAALDAAKQILHHLWDFLSSLCHKYQISCVTS